MSKFLAQILINGASVVVRAMVQAYQQAIVNAKGAGGAQQAMKTMARRNKMTTNEAMEILEIEGTPTIESITAKYDKYFAANDPAKGGSFYLQSKVYRARERLELDLSGVTDDDTENPEGPESKK